VAPARPKKCWEELWLSGAGFATTSAGQIAFFALGLFPTGPGVFRAMKVPSIWVGRGGSAAAPLWAPFPVNCGNNGKSGYGKETPADLWAEHWLEKRINPGLWPACRRIETWRELFTGRPQKKPSSGGTPNLPRKRRKNSGANFARVVRIAWGRSRSGDQRRPGPRTFFFPDGRIGPGSFTRILSGGTVPKRLRKRYRAAGAGIWRGFPRPGPKTEFAAALIEKN